MAEKARKPARGRRRRFDRKWLVAALPGIGVTVLLLFLHVAWRPALISELSYQLFDEYQRIAPRPYQSVPVKIVDIDDETLARLGQWPWPRTDIARLSQTLAKAGASAIAFDMVFSEPDRTSPARVAAILRKDPDAKGNFDAIAAMPDHDAILGKALASVPAVTGYILDNTPNAAKPALKFGFSYSGSEQPEVLQFYRGAIISLPAIDSGASGSGFVSIEPSPDGRVRFAPLLATLHGETYPSLSMEALRVAQGAGTIIVKTTDGSGEIGGDKGIDNIKVGDFVVPTMRGGELWMYYRQPRPDDTVPAWKVLTPGVLSDAQMKSLFAGRIVFVGTGAEGLRDNVSTPISDVTMLGAQVHAQAVEQIMLGKFLVAPGWASGLESLLLILFGVGLSLSLPVIGALRGGIAGAFALALTGAGSWFAFRSYGFMLDPTYPAIEVVLAYVTCTLYAFYREERARSYIHRAFDRYLSPEQVLRIVSDPDQLKLGGEERDMTVMFCDIRGFSRISEKLTPQQVIEFLIEFLTPTTDVLLEHNATIDKFIGDAILAFWNAPVDNPDHIRDAALGSLALVRTVKELNAANIGATDKTWPGEVRIGVGLDTGPCCVGNIGTKKKLNYSLIGDTVNLASRIEGLTKVYGVAIAMGNGTASRLVGFAAIEIDFVRVVGRDTPERLHALIGPPEMTTDPAFQRLTALQREFLEAYRAQSWDQAEAQLSELSSLGDKFDLKRLFAVYHERIQSFRQTPLPQDWDGVFEAAHK